MRGPKPEVINLTHRQRAILQQWVRRGKSSQQLVRRANIILAADSGAANEQIAQQLKVDRNTVITWRSRWADTAEKLTATEAKETDKVLEKRIADLLDDCSRRGTPPTFSAEQICQMVALACEDPQKSGRPISHWTPKELADESVKRGIVHSISPRHVGRFFF